jgi:gas vesicle protein
MSENKDALLVFILGGLIGAVLGVLYAPRPGKETRRSIKKISGDIIDTIGNLGDDFAETGKKVYEGGEKKIFTSKNKMSKVFEAGRKAFEECTKCD